MAGDLQFWDKIRYLFSRPFEFGGMVKKERGIGNALLMYVIVAFFASLVSYGISITFMMAMGSLMGAGNYFGGAGFFGGFSAFIGFGIGLVMTFLYSAIMHAIVIAFKGNGGYAATYRMLAYSLVPATLIGIIPLIGMLGFIYSFFIMIPGIALNHNISKGKAALVCLLPLALFLGLFIILAVFLLFSFMRTYI